MEANIFLQTNQGVSLVWNPQLVAVWNQTKGLDGITATPCMASSRRGIHGFAVMIYSPEGADDIHRTSRGDDIPSLRLG